MTYDKHYAAEFNRARHEWHLAEHITTPRKSCEGLPRKYGPPDIKALEFDAIPPQEEKTYRPGERHPEFKCIHYTPSHRWRGQYTIDGKRYYTPTKRTGLQAALAFNDAIRKAGLPRHRMIEIPNMKEAS